MHEFAYHQFFKFINWSTLPTMLSWAYRQYQSRNKTSVLMFYRRIKYRCEFGCVWIKSQVCWHECFNYTHPNEYGYFILR